MSFTLSEIFIRNIFLRRTPSIKSVTRDLHFLFFNRFKLEMALDFLDIQTQLYLARAKRLTVLSVLFCLSANTAIARLRGSFLGKTGDASSVSLSPECASSLFSITIICIVVPHVLRRSDQIHRETYLAQCTVLTNKCNYFSIYLLSFNRGLVAKSQN